MTDFLINDGRATSICRRSRNVTEKHNLHSTTQATDPNLTIVDPFHRADDTCFLIWWSTAAKKTRPRQERQKTYLTVYGMSAIKVGLPGVGSVRSNTLLPRGSCVVLSVVLTVLCSVWLQMNQCKSSSASRSLFSNYNSWSTKWNDVTISQREVVDELNIVLIQFCRVSWDGPKHLLQSSAFHQACK